MPRTRIAAAALALAAIIPVVALADMAPKADDPVSLRKQMM